MKQILTLVLLGSVMLISCNDISSTADSNVSYKNDELLTIPFSNWQYAQVYFKSTGKNVNRLGKALVNRSVTIKGLEVLGYETSISSVEVNGKRIHIDSIISIDFGDIKYPKN